MRGCLKLLAVAGQAAMVCCFALASADAQTILTLRGPDAGANARSTALGDAYTAESSDASTLYWNPAALAFLDRSSIIIDYSRTVNNSTYHYAAAAPLRLSERTSIAIGGIAYYWTPIGVPIGLRGKRQKEYSIDIAAAHRVGYSVSLGLSTKFHMAQIANTQLLAAFTSFGVFYAPSPEISYGLIYEGVELASSLGSTNGEAIVRGWERLPRKFALGIAMRYPSSRNERQLTISVSNEKQIGVRGLSYKLGVEVYPWQFLALRTGFLTGPEAESLRYGMGIRSSPVEVAYAYVPYSLKGRYHQLSVYIGMN